MSLLLPQSSADRVAWAGIAGGSLVLVGALAQYWGANPAHADRFLILVGAAWTAYSLGASLASLPVRPRPVAGLPLMLAGIVAFPVGVFLLVQIGPRTLLLWWLATALVSAAGGLSLARLGWPRTRAFAFPLFFPLFALPVPLRVLTPLQDMLQDVTTTMAHFGLSGFGLAVTREEFVLALPGGRLRVEEACSGVRSVTALTAIAAFVAFLKGFGPVRGSALVMLAIPVVAMVNVLRVILSGVIQESIGPEYIQGDWHEALGFAMVLVGMVLVLGLASLIGPRAIPAIRPTQAESGESPSGGFWPWTSAGLIAIGAVATLILGMLGRTSEEQTREVAPVGEISLTLGSWEGESLPVPTVVTDLLAPDQFVYRAYRNNIGQVVYVWVLHWGPGAAIKGYHHPDVCWGNKGFTPTGRWIESVPVPGGVVRATAREFQRDGDRQFVLYWTQEGRRVWTDVDEQAAASDMLTSSWSGHRWVGDRLGATGTGGPRLSVIVVAPSSGRAAERNKRDAISLTRLVAADLYRSCPWAAPSGERGE